jgi:hypothetical protein
LPARALPEHQLPRAQFCCGPSVEGYLVDNRLAPATWFDPKVSTSTTRRFVGLRLRRSHSLRTTRLQRHSLPRGPNADGYLTTGPRDPEKIRVYDVSARRSPLPARLYHSHDAGRSVTVLVYTTKKPVSRIFVCIAIGTTDQKGGHNHERLS